MNVESYIQPGDEISVMYRSLTLECFHGTVVEVGDGVPGTREIVVVREGTTLLDAGAIGVREDAAVFSVKRGDSWVQVPTLLTIEDATKKAERNLVNQVKRIQKQAPLFADQIEPTALNPEEWVKRDHAAAQEQLTRLHAHAMASNTLRDEMRALISDEDFTYLCGRRERYGKDALYGKYFWNKQLAYFREHGQIERFVPPPPMAESLKFDWLKYGSQLTWATAPGGPQQVVVHWVGPTEVLCQLAGEPFKDFDPKQFPESRNVWLKPEDFEEANCATAA